ncbi:MAG: PHP domain-containing protein [Candidatus Aminicenantes bacterium]|nr:PHP domain-containing protein [Candidatus Aminicenantes bacterium]
MKIAADLHIHSALSPCSSLEMSPAAIIRRARELKLDAIAVTDHNSMANCFSTAAIGKKNNLQVFFGMEAQTREDVHILCLFQSRSQAEQFNDHIYALLPDIKNNPLYFGDQVVVDEQDNIIRHEEKLLLNALDASIAELFELVRRYQGFAIPAHVESAPFGLLVNMGLIPVELDASVMEISCATRPQAVLQTFPELARFPLISNSDAHFLKDIGRAYTIFDAAEASLPSLIQAATHHTYHVHFRNCHG